ncbi:CerR family C-terminal domain-containing protein [Mesobacterium sp. TK19101]|uniref:CerR family C-terminal domain-containing protein n=1 Tax=Mesobacterium hydrothermale TaxID=3111907 RepID=A0ABU6HGH4_9RHOB|nr:CerR family C-terminal domain-containing protein [Mesobacterium sp. TK19101]MEC3861558.1 CerR family C-terminal domain-containing protein [Mesobacterium sp. TK19101]
MDAAETHPTRAALVQAALELFGQQGFDATSTRQLAERAGVNVAAISYHFGGKAGLRSACAQAVVSRISQAFGAAMDSDMPQSPAAAADQIEAVLRRLVSLLVAAPDTQGMVAFVLRELSHPGEVTDTIYSQVFAPRHAHLCRLWAIATGQPPEAEATRLTVFSIIGQVLYFRIAQPIVERRMDWAGIGQEQAGQIADVVVRNLRATLERHQI